MGRTERALQATTDPTASTTRTMRRQRLPNNPRTTVLSTVPPPSAPRYARPGRAAGLLPGRLDACPFGLAAAATWRVTSSVSTPLVVLKAGRARSGHTGIATSLRHRALPRCTLHHSYIRSALCASAKVATGKLDRRSAAQVPCQGGQHMGALGLILQRAVPLPSINRVRFSGVLGNDVALTNGITRRSSD